jgi:transcriptional regulator with XRE-family HTH domain
MGTSSLHSPQYQKFCAKLRAWREDAGLTQRDLGKRLGKPHSYVAKTETGQRRMDPLEFIAWCKQVGVDPAEEIRRLARAVR